MGGRQTRALSDAEPLPPPAAGDVGGDAGASPSPGPAAGANSRAMTGLQAGSLLARRWLLLERVGRGAFGDIFIAECVAADPLTAGRRVALKVEKLEVADEATVKAALEADRKQKEKEAQRLTAAAAGNDTTAAAAAAPGSLPPPAAPLPRTPAPYAHNQSSTLPLPSQPLPSEPLSPFTPLPGDSPGAGGSSASAVSASALPAGSAAPPVYMKRCIVKLEAAVLSKLQSFPAVPRFVEYGRDSGQQVAFLAMELLGENLLRLRRQQKKLRFSLPTALRFGLQALRCLEAMHEVGFIHRDVKPSNFVIGRGGNSDRIFIIDFGLARAYKDRLSGEILPPRPDIGGFRGTPRYASVYVHREQDLSRRDDLLSLLYILVEFVTGDLPWGAKRDKAVIGRIKERYHGARLLKGCPSCFLPFFKHVSGLRFEDRPDYDLLRSLLETKLSKLKVRPDALYDWEGDCRETAAAADDGLYSVQAAAMRHGPAVDAAVGRKAAAEEKESGGAEAAGAGRMRIVLDRHEGLVEVRHSLAPKTPPPPPPAADGTEEEQKEAEPASAVSGAADDEASAQLQSPLGLGDRQLSASISLSYSPSSHSQQPLSSRCDRAQPASPALSLFQHRPSTSSSQQSPHFALDDAEDGVGDGDAACGALVASFEAGIGVRQLRSLDENSLNLRRKQRGAAHASGGSEAGLSNN